MARQVRSSSSSAGPATGADVAPVAGGASPEPPGRASARISRQLGTWALASVGVGAVLLATSDGPAWNAFALQCLAWGAIDGVIALAGASSARRARRTAGDPARTAAEHDRLRRLLLINAGLDVVYVLVGIAIVVWWRTDAGFGHGVGVLVQGGFLLGFDAWHAWRLR